MRAASARWSTVTIRCTNSMHAFLATNMLSVSSSSSMNAARIRPARARSPRRSAARASRGFFIVCVPLRDVDVVGLVEQLPGLAVATLHRRREAEVRECPLQGRRRTVRAVTLDDRRHQGVVFLQPPRHQQRPAQGGDLGQVGDVVRAPLAQVGQRGRHRFQHHVVVVVEEPTGVADHGVIRLPVPADEALVPLDVHVPHVAPRRPDDTEEDQRFVVRWGDGEDPLRPVPDLGATPQVDLGGDRSDERVGEPAIAGGARPLDRGAEVRPQLVEPGGAFDLGGPLEELDGCG